MPRETHVSDITDAQWLHIEPLMPGREKIGRPRAIDMREVVNAVRYLLTNQCRWRDLPAYFPNRSTVRHYYDLWRSSGVWDRIEHAIQADERPKDDSIPGGSMG